MSTNSVQLFMGLLLPSLPVIHSLNLDVAIMLYHISRVSLHKARQILLATPISHRPCPFLSAHSSSTPPRQKNFLGTALVHTIIGNRIHIWHDSLTSLLPCKEIQFPCKLRYFICWGCHTPTPPGIFTPDCDITKLSLPLTLLLISAYKVAQASCNFEGFFENILLQDTVIEQNLYLVKRYNYFKRKVSYYKIQLLQKESVLLQDTAADFSI